MKISKNKVKQLDNNVSGHKVICQFCGKLIEVSNDTEKENKATLFGHSRRASRVKVYAKHSKWTKDSWLELTDWSPDDDVLSLLDNVGVLICIPKKEALANNLIMT